jgi:amino acid transporter
MLSLSLWSSLIYLAVIANFIATALLGVSFKAFWDIETKNKLQTWMQWLSVVFAIVHAVIGIAGLAGCIMFKPR